MRATLSALLCSAILASACGAAAAPATSDATPAAGQTQAPAGTPRPTEEGYGY